MVKVVVSMKSGLEGRNNNHQVGKISGKDCRVSMKSGLEGRNNAEEAHYPYPQTRGVSMKSGLEGRNNSLNRKSHGNVRFQSQ